MNKLHMNVPRLTSNAGGGSLVAQKCNLDGGKLSLMVERFGAAHLTLCKLTSLASPGVAQQIPPKPKPGKGCLSKR
jgi:hypothetical protein